MLMDCQNVVDVCRFVIEFYREVIIVSYMVRFVVFVKRIGEEEGKFRMFCMIDDRIDKIFEKQENFREVVRSRDVEVRKFELRGFIGNYQFVNIFNKKFDIYFC